MTVDQILKLAELGYTKDEIKAMDAPAAEPVEKEEMQPHAEATEDTEPKRPDDLAEILRETSEVNKQLMETIKKLQSDNAKAARQPEPEKKGAADVIRNFIQGG